MKNIFIDTNIILDILSERHPYYDSASALVSKGDYRKIKIYASSVSLVTVDYIITKDTTEKEAREILRKFRVLLEILPCTEKEIDLALNSDMKDFEDAVQYHIALENDIDCIITRNLKDFKGSKIPVMTAEQFLKTHR